MPTTKTIKIQKNKILTYSINKTGFQTVNKSIVVTEDTTINENMVSQSGSPILQLGDRLLGISTFFMYFTPSGEYDVNSLKHINGTQTTGTDLGIIVVSKEVWLQQIEDVLGIETPRGTSKDFIFTFNGSNWDLTGAVTVSGISTADLNNIYGVNYTGSADTIGDVITVTETQYNKFACYVLDSNYRFNGFWATRQASIMPKQYSSNPENCLESATYYNEYIWNNANPTIYTGFYNCKNKGLFILNNDIKINCLIPNVPELSSIWSNRIILDSFDPVIQAGGTNYNLTNWNFESSMVHSCLQQSSSNSWYCNSSGNILSTNQNRYIGIIPIFEVPVM